ESTRLMDGEPQMSGALFDCAHVQNLPAARRPIRLGEHRFDPVPGACQRIERGNGKLGGAGESQLQRPLDSVQGSKEPEWKCGASLRRASPPVCRRPWN